MKKRKYESRKRDYYDDEWEDGRDRRKRYDKVKKAIKNARRNKKRQRDAYLMGGD